MPSHRPGPHLQHGSAATVCHQPVDGGRPYLRLRFRGDSASSGARRRADQPVEASGVGRRQADEPACSRTGQRRHSAGDGHLWLPLFDDGAGEHPAYLGADVERVVRCPGWDEEAVAIVQHAGGPPLDRSPRRSRRACTRPPRPDGDSSSKVIDASRQRSACLAVLSAVRRPRSGLHGPWLRAQARATHVCILGLSPRGRLEQTFDLRVEIPGDRQSCLAPVRSDEARHRVVGQVHSVSALVDEDRHRCVRCRVGNGLWPSPS